MTLAISCRILSTSIAPCFFFNDTATTEIYTLSLHDALPISKYFACSSRATGRKTQQMDAFEEDRKSTRLNSSHMSISYAVFCLKKKKRGPPHSKRLWRHIAI